MKQGLLIFIFLVKIENCESYIILVFFYFELNDFIHIYQHNCRNETTVEPNGMDEPLSKPSRCTSKNRSTSNGIYNEPVVKPSRIKSMVNYRNERSEVQKQEKLRRVENNYECLDSAGKSTKNFQFM